MDVLVKVVPESDPRRSTAALELIALALARSLSAPALATGGDVSVYGAVDDEPAGGPP